MNWLKNVGEASSPQALLGVVNEYLLLHSEEWWSWIPRQSRPPLVASIAELHRWHHQLASDVGSATNPNIRLQDLCVLFVRAAARAAEIEHEARSTGLANETAFDARVPNA